MAYFYIMIDNLPNEMITHICSYLTSLPLRINKYTHMQLIRSDLYHESISIYRNNIVSGRLIINDKNMIDLHRILYCTRRRHNNIPMREALSIEFSTDLESINININQIIRAVALYSNNLLLNFSKCIYNHNMSFVEYAYYNKPAITSLNRSNESSIIFNRMLSIMPGDLICALCSENIQLFQSYVNNWTIDAVIDFCSENKLDGLLNYLIHSDDRYLYSEHKYAHHNYEW